MVKTKRERLIEDKSQKSLSFFDDTFKSSEEENRHISHENHIEDSKLLKEENRYIFDFVDFDDELKKIKKEDQNIRSEQIYINDSYYNKIFSILCRHYIYLKITKKYLLS